MDFMQMGQIDAQAEIEKNVTYESDVKGATIRVSDGYLELLNSVSEVVGLSRQAFMSKLVENFATQAVADYYRGYSTSFSDTKLADLFPKAPNEGMQKSIDGFIKNVQYIIAYDNAAEDGVRALPLENINKLRWSHVKRDRILAHSQNIDSDITFCTELPPLPEEQK